MQNRRSLPPLEDDFTRALLRSAEVDEPPRAAYAKVAAALGVGTALGVGASLPAPAVAVAGASGASALARWCGTLAGKLTLLGVSGALLLGAGAAFLRHRSTSKSVATRSSVVSAAPTSAPLLTAEPQVSMAPAGSAQGAAQSAVAVSPAEHASTGGESRRNGVRAQHAAFHGLRSSASSLPEQVQSLDRARVALSSGDSGAALIEIAHYRKAWPKGVSLTEASVLEIEALAKRGERSLAAMRAQAFVIAHPDSPQADRLRALIPTAQP
jgi:hypothetical protein